MSASHSSLRRRGPEMAVDQVLGRIGYLPLYELYLALLLAYATERPSLRLMRRTTFGHRDRIVPPHAARA